MGGHRASEPILDTAEALANDAFDAFRDAMETGAFAFLGHSIGCLIVTELARRARAELGVEPVAVIMVERGAPQYPVFTEWGYDLLHTNPEEMMSFRNKLVWEMYQKGGDVGKRTMEMWQRGWFVENNTREVGWHLFRCPILAIHADSTVRCVALSDAERQAMSQMFKCNFHWSHKEDGRTFMGHFPRYTYEAWAQWTEHSKGADVRECFNCDHMTIKSSAAFLEMVWAYLTRQVIELF